jgi:ATP-dependent Clp protease ATP-binding subunit ClpA
MSPDEPSRFELRLTPQARHELKRAVAEAGLLQQGHLGTEQLLRGLLEESESMAAELPRKVGVEAKQNRDLAEERLH